MPRKVTRQKEQLAPVVVVAGGAGFLGSHLCESLLKSGATVLALDDLVTGSMSNLAEIKRHPHFEFFDCNTNQGLPPGLADRSITHVIQASGVETHVGDEALNLAGLLSGAFSTKNLLDLAVSSGARFTLVSSLNVYQGIASSTSLDYYYGSSEEQDSSFSHYEAWRYAEALCEAYAKQYGLDARVARISQVYGPRMDLSGGTLIAQLVRDTLAGKDLEVKEEGSQELMLTYISDVVYGLSRLMFADGDQYRHAIYPLFNPEKVSIISIAYTLRGYLPSGKEVRFVQHPQHNAFSLPKAAIDRTKKDLDWEPSINVTDGLKMTIEAFRQLKELPPQHKVTKEQLATIMPVAPVPPAQPISAPLPVVEAAAPLVPTPPPTPTAEAWQQGLKYRGKPATEIKDEAQAAPTVAPAAPTKQVKAKAGWWRRLFVAAILLGVYVGLGRPMLQTTAYAAAGGIDLRQGAAAAKRLQLTQAADKFEAARGHLAAAQASVQSLSWLAGVLHQQPTYAQLNQSLLAMTAASDGLATTATTMQPLVQEVRQLVRFRQHSEQPTANLTQMTETASTGLRQAHNQFGQALSLLSTSQTQVAGASSDGQAEQIGEGLLTGPMGQARTILVQAQTLLTQAEQVTAAMPAVLGAADPQRYLVMLQNSNELRPTGGFMGSYIELEVAGGSIQKFAVDDIYNPDGQLHSSQAIAAPFTQALDVTQQNIRDANWSPDATVSAQLISSLYAEATGKQVDGVIFVTTQAIRPILANLGSIDLPGYQESVTADNFDTLAQVHSDVGFTPGSTAKRDFLGRLAEAMISRLEQGDEGLWAPFGKGIMTGLSTKEIQISLHNQDIQSLVDAQGWSGRTAAAAGDYLRVVDANLASNKSNYYVTRKTDYAVNVDRQRGLHGVAKITWEHDGTSGTWPGGDYRNYVRIYVPQGSNLVQGINFDQNKVDTYDEGDKTVFGGFVTIGYHSQKTVELRYDLPEDLGLSVQGGAYQLTWQKQAGIVDEPVAVQFNAPVFLKTANASAGATVASGKASWSLTGNDDHTVKLQLESVEL